MSKLVFPLDVFRVQLLGVGFVFVSYAQPRLGREGQRATDEDPPYHLGPLAKLSSLLTQEQLQFLIEFIWRHYRAPAARGAARLCGFAP